MLFLLPMIVLVALGASDQGAILPVSSGAIERLTGYWLAVLLLGVLVPWRTHARARRRLERTGDLRWINLSRRTAQRQALIVTLWFATGLVALGWVGTVRRLTGDLIAIDEFLSLLPWLLTLGLIGWQCHPLERLLHEAALIRELDRGDPIEAMPSRFAWGWLKVRETALFMLVPGCLVLGWWEASERLLHAWHRAAPGLGLLRDAAGMTSVPTGLGTGVQFVGVVAVALVVPPIMVRILPTSALREGEFAAYVRESCQRVRVRPPSLRLWNPSQRFANAAVLGLLAPSRSLLVTRRLVESLTEHELRAVAMHEIGHMRFSHIPWILASILSTLIWAGLLEETLRNMRGGSFSSLLSIWAGMALPFLSLLAVIGVLGFVSRRFEWQADAFAAAELSRASGEVTYTESACANLAYALLRVAHVNGSSPSRPDMLHGSIDLRCRLLADLVGRPLKMAPINRTSQRLRVVIALLLVSGIVTLVVA